MSELDDRITKVIAWYEANRKELDSAMPLTHQGTTHTVRSLANQDEAIALYRAGELQGRLRDAYVWQSLIRLYKAFEAHKKEVEGG